MADNVNEEKLAIDIFIKYSSRDINDFRKAIISGKQILMRDIHLDERFNPKKYVRFYITFRVMNLEDNKPLPKFNILQQRIERVHNAAISLEIMEKQLDDLNLTDNLFYYYEVGAIYVLDDKEKQNTAEWFILNE